MGILLDALRSVDFLADAPPFSAVRLMALGRSLDFAKGHEFWRSGDEAREVVIPVTGEAETVLRDFDGRELVDRCVGPGECLGIVSALDGLPHPQDARVVRDGEFFVVGREAFLRFLDESPDLRRAAMEAVGRLYRRSLREREEGVFEHVSQRVARFLVRRSCVRQGDGARILVHATHADIAARLGSVREVVARTFATFADRGLVARQGHGYFITDWNGLHAEAVLEPPPHGRAASLTRTSRFFLPMTERRRGRHPSEDAAICREFAKDMSLCRQRGCPAALNEAWHDGRSTTPHGGRDAAHARKATGAATNGRHPG